MRTRCLALPFLALLAEAAVGQKTLVERRDQAQGWYLPVECNVMANGGKTDSVSITIFKDNEQVSQVAPEKNKSRFALELDLDGYFTIRVQKEGYREKLVYVDTHLPENQVKYGAYDCFVNLEPLDKFAHAEPFYLDFPCAIVRWSEEKQSFQHSVEYIADIQIKMALLGAQLEPR